MKYTLLLIASLLVFCGCSAESESNNKKHKKPNDIPDTPETHNGIDVAINVSSDEYEYGTFQNTFGYVKCVFIGVGDTGYSESQIIKVKAYEDDTLVETIDLGIPDNFVRSFYGQGMELELYFGHDYGSPIAPGMRRWIQLEIDPNHVSGDINTDNNIGSANVTMGTVSLTYPG